MATKASSSQFKGVCCNKKYNVWHGYLVHNNMRYHLGTFNHEVDAAKAYARAWSPRMFKPPLAPRWRYSPSWRSRSASAAGRGVPP